MAHQMLTVSDVAERLRVSRDIVVTHIRAGRLRASNVGTSMIRMWWRVSEEDLEKFLSVRRLTPPVPRGRKRWPKVTQYV